MVCVQEKLTVKIAGRLRLLAVPISIPPQPWQHFGSKETAAGWEVTDRAQDGQEYWGDCQTLFSLHVGSGLSEDEGHNGWRMVTLTFEVHTG